MIRPPPRSTLFPTRRSSDLAGRASAGRRHGTFPRPSASAAIAAARARRLSAGAGVVPGAKAGPAGRVLARSEEHTSELQSQSNLVCRLLLEKKNNHTCMRED